MPLGLKKYVGTSQIDLAMRTASNFMDWPPSIVVGTAIDWRACFSSPRACALSDPRVVAY
jgi:hypothetical protein